MGTLLLALVLGVATVLTPSSAFAWGAARKPPFPGLPRDLVAARANFGRVTLKLFGMLPWRVEEFAGALRRGFEGMRQRGAYSISAVVLFSAVRRKCSPSAC